MELISKILIQTQISNNHPYTKRDTKKISV